MKVLVIGGTEFVGRHTVEGLLTGGHEVVLLNRGKSAPGLFKGIRHIACDRGNDEIVGLLKRESGFDAVIDFCAYFPRDIEKLLPVLPSLTNHYVQISSVSAYKATEQDSIPFIRDDDPLSDFSKSEEVDQTDATYGKRKAGCDRLAMNQSREGVPVTVFRPSLIYGKYDPTDRFGYWIWKVARKEPFLLPDDGLCITRRTYAPDFSKTILKALNYQKVFHQAYNVAETEPLSLRATLQIIGDQLGTDPFDYAIPAQPDFLTQMDVKPWSDLPMWIPRTNLILDTCKVRRDLEPMETPARQAIQAACNAFLELGRVPKAGISPEREREIIRKIPRRRSSRSEARSVET